MTSHITDVLYSTTCVTRNRQISLFNIMKTATENGACVCATVIILAHGALKRLMRILCFFFSSYAYLNSILQSSLHN